MSDIVRIVVIGGGQAAGWAVRTLREQGYAGSISVVADEVHDFYERPPLSKEILAGSREPKDLMLFAADAVNAWNIDWHRPRRAVSIDRAARKVRLDDGTELSYDRLLIATGSRPRMPDPEWLKIPGVVVLRNIDDALNLRERLRASKRLAVVGGGWIGLEVAALARSLGIEVIVYERAPALCGRSVGPDVAQRLAELHRHHAIVLHLDCGDLQLAADEKGVRITAKDGADTFDTVLVGAGAQINTELAQAAGLEVRSGIVVDATGCSSDVHIFAAGDVAQHPDYGLCVQSWANAQNQGIATAKGMLGQSVQYDEVPWLWSDQHGVNIQILGIYAPEGRSVRRRDAEGREIFFQLDGRDRLRQMVAFGDPRAIKLGRRWMVADRNLPVESLADPEFDLMKLR